MRDPGTRVGSRTLLARTCKQCGQLLPGAKFDLASYGSRRGICRACLYKRSKHRDRSADYQRRNQSPSRKAWVSSTVAGLLDTATRHGQQWTGPELELLARDDGLSITGKAQLLGRSYWATAAMARKLRRGEPTPVWLAGTTTTKETRP